MNLIKMNYYEYFIVFYGKIVRFRINCNILIEYLKFWKYYLVFWYISVFFKKFFCYFEYNY